MMQMKVADHVQTVNLDNQMTLVNTESGVVARLNEMGGWVWSRLKQNASWDNAAKEAEEQFGVTEEILKQDIDTFLNQLVKIGILKPK